MRIFKNKDFHIWFKDIGLEENTLTDVVSEISQGLFEANLGGYIYKKRIAIGNRGKSSGVRTIVAFKAQYRAIFIYGFTKNKRENITRKEEHALKILAMTYMNFNDEEINKAIKYKQLFEVYKQ